MPGSAIISPASFGDTSLPRLDLRPLSMIPDAAYDWAADRLGAGPLDSWYDMVQGAAFVAPTPPSQKPVVIESGRKVVRFNGVDQRMDANINMPGPMTMVLVARAATDANSNYIVTGNGGALHVYRGATGKWSATGGNAIAHPTDANTVTHVFVVVRDGVNSFLSVDGVEAAGNLGTQIATGLRIGGSSSAYFASDIQRLALLPFAANQKQRAALASQMRAAYSI